MELCRVVPNSELKYQFYDHLTKPERVMLLPIHESTGISPL